jgi:hypothetical protein
MVRRRFELSSIQKLCTRFEVKMDQILISTYISTFNQDHDFHIYLFFRLSSVVGHGFQSLFHSHMVFS